MRTRFAPSPTGSLHVGNARIAVLNWLLTQKHDGRFLLRIEDTDTERHVEEAVGDICRDLRWLGLDWDEGPSFEGRPEPGLHAPYRQSERLAIYRRWAAALRARGLVYPCFCTDDDIAAMRESAIAAGRQPHYDGRCARLEPGVVAERERAGEPFTLRFRVPADTAVTIRDALRGEIRFDADAFGDFVVLRSDGRPTYNFAVVVDDIAMEITHVIRGSGHLSNTPRQQLLYEAFDRPPPVFAHIPMVLGPDRQKLSKRHGAKPVAAYRAEGWHPDALVNYLSLLSWSSPSGEEFLARDRLIEEISLDRIGSADVVFDADKLRWLSARHIEAMPLDELVAAVQPFLGPDSAWIEAALLPEAVQAVRSHLTTFGEIETQLGALGPPPAAAPPLDTQDTHVVRAARDVFAAVDPWSEDALKAALA